MDVRLLVGTRTLGSYLIVLRGGADIAEMPSWCDALTFRRVPMHGN